MEQAGYQPGQDFRIAIDAAATEMFDAAKEQGKKDQYLFWKTGKLYTRRDMIDFYGELSEKYPIISLEMCIRDS